MELVCSNFEKEEEHMLGLIKSSDFISFDLEMTGIENDKNNIIIDTPENRYLKYKKTSEKYSIIQLGFTLFKQEKNINNINNNNNKKASQILYHCYPYNLYLFPNANDLKTLSQDNMNLEIKSMLFNRNGKIDFNKWINEGIYYLNQKQYRELYKNITSNNINNDDFYMDTSMLLRKPSDIELAENIINEVKENFINVKTNANSYIIDSMPKFLLYYIKKKLPNNLYYKENYKMFRNWCTLITRFNTKEEKDELYKNDVLGQLRELEHKKGVKKIIDAIFNKVWYGNQNIDEKIINDNENKKNKKILIGHNMSLDLMFIVANLGDSLPDEYLKFKKMIKNYFEYIYDTKLLFEEFKKNEIQLYNNPLIKNIKSVLDNMYPYLKSRFGDLVKTEIKTRDEKFNDEQFHSAGYDSYITGLCFLYMKYGAKTGQILENNKNKIFFMNSLYKSMDLNKEKDEYILDVDTPEENIFIFRGFKKASNINFENIFGKDLWNDSVIKTIYDEKYNIIIAFTNFKKEVNEQNKTEFKIIAKTKTFNDIFTAFTLGEFRNKYMKN